MTHHLSRIPGPTLTVVCALASLAPQPGRAEVLVETESLYHHIIVEANGSVRSMLFRRRGTDNSESVVDLSAPLRPQMEYTRLMFSALFYCDQPKDILVIGLGGGTLSTMLAHYFPEASVVTVELDPVVAELAAKHFAFKQGPKNKVEVRDGRVYVKRALRQPTPRFDLIMLDAFRGGYIPFHLTTKEFLTECKQLLKPAGIVVANLRPGFDTYEYQRRTMNAVFGTGEAFGGSSNVAVCTLPAGKPVPEQELSKRARALQARHRFEFDLPAVVDTRQRQPDYPQQGDILTDDYAPVNIERRR